MRGQWYGSRRGSLTSLGWGRGLRVGGTARQGPGIGQEPGRVHVSGRVRHLGRCKSLGCKRPRGDRSMEVQEYDTRHGEVDWAWEGARAWKGAGALDGARGRDWPGTGQ